MGIFSLFKKKDEDELAGITLGGEATRMAGYTEAERARQREIARATAMKIDAIEQEMTSDLFDDGPASAHRVPRQVTASPIGDASTLVLHDFPTTLLLTDEELHEVLPNLAPAEDSGVEEAALIYANGDATAARALLEDLVQGKGAANRQHWWLLFDLYQADNAAADFEALSLAYAEQFETSPPPWRPLGMPAVETTVDGSALPQAVLPLTLDASVSSELERIAAQPAVCLDIGGVLHATPEGCALLLQLLRSHPGLTVAGAAELAATLRPTLAVGDNSAPEAPWQLVLECLQRAADQAQFDDVAMDYCVTYEISPPQYLAPTAGASAARATTILAQAPRFALSGSIVGTPPAFEAHIAEHGSLIFDCAALQRLDYAAASALLARLRPVAESGIQVEFRALSHLVAGLLRLLGTGEAIALFPHKY